jgi:hypothetical protein
MSDDDQEFNFQNTDIAESTDMKADMFANSEKLRPRDERWSFSKDDNHNNDDVDEDINSYKKEVSNNDEIHTDVDNKSVDNKSVDNKSVDNKSVDNKINGESNKNDNKDDDEYDSLSTNEKRLRRLEYMRKLGELRDLGCKVTNYSINDDYYMMKYEYELHTSIRTKRNWMQLYNHILIGAVKGVELVNNRYNPFDFSLKGLSNEVSADKNSYYEILGEIYEHYNVPGKKMNPWMRLFVTLIGTVVIVGGKNNAHKFIPGVASKVENDEALLEKLRAKAASGNNPNQVNRETNQVNREANQVNRETNQPKQTAGFDDLFEKEHSNTVQKIKDLEELKRQELEYQQLQKMLADDDDKFNKVKQRLEMSQRSPESVSERSKNKTTTRNQRQLQSSAVKDSDSRSTLSNQSNQSSRSVISVNKTLQSQLNKNTIKASSISFGSSAKGKKPNVNVGSR